MNVLDSKVGSSNQKMKEFKTQRKTGQVNSRVRALICGIVDSGLFSKMLDGIPEGS